MTTDNPAAQESGDLSIDAAASAFSQLLEPVAAEEEVKVDTEVDPPKKPDEEPNAAEEGDDAPVTVTVAGKQVTLTKAEIEAAVLGQMKDADYRQKTAAVAEQRRAAEAEIAKTQQERQTYAVNLQKMAAQLEGAIQQQEKIDWNALLESDPVEFLKQKHLYDQRQVALQKNQHEMQELSKRAQAEAAEAHRSHLTTQQEQLLAKLPEWKDETKAKSEREAIKAYLQKEGYEAKDIDAISDHRAVVMSRKAMLYDQMMAKASAAAKKVQNLPTKVERPGVSTDRNPLDGRTQAMKRLEKTGSVEDAARVFATLL